MEEHQRNSNIELLRIIMMWFIVLGHGAIAEQRINMVDNSSLLLVFKFIGQSGQLFDNVFIIITAYYCFIKYQSLRYTKLIILWLQIEFYSVGIYIGGVLLGLIEFSLKELLTYLMPVSFEVWWFVTSYFLFYIFAPYIGESLNKLDKKKYIHLVCFSTIIWGIIPTIVGQEMLGNYFTWFIYVYIVIGYYVKYIDKKISWPWCLVFALIIEILQYIYEIIMLNCGKEELSLHFIRLQRLPTLITAFFLFLVFVKIKVKHNGTINKLARCTFGIYLIHAHPVFDENVWNKLLYINAPFNYTEVIDLGLIATIIFLGCILVEIVRRALFNKIYVIFNNIVIKKGNPTS